MSQVLAIDEGTTGVRAVRVDAKGRPLAARYREFRQIYPRPGWVEHDAEEIWRATLGVLRGAAAGGRDVVAVGVTNQRETTVVWDRRTGKPVHPAVVWQCRRTAEACRALERRGLAPLIRRKTGLVPDAYFSATKLRWILDRVGRPDRLCFGTIDSWLLWNLSGGRVHATDPTNASRTMLYDIDRGRWDDDLLRLFRVPRSMLPEVRPSAGDFGRLAPGVLRSDVPIRGVAGDQQAALFGQGCTAPGSMKHTYGTGGFLMINTGRRRRDSRAGLLTTLACGPRGGTVYALEGAVFIAGAAIQYLRDALGIVDRAGDTEALARKAPADHGVHFVPAFTGLGAPYWDMDARGAILGLTRGSDRAVIARAALEAIAFQTRDMIEAGGVKVRELRVDGGAVRNDFLMQFQADLLGIPVLRPAELEVTALGAAALAGLAVGYWRDRRELEVARQGGTLFDPGLDRERRDRLYAGWKRAVERSRGWALE
jgi:glycerol kinase